MQILTDLMAIISRGVVFAGSVYTIWNAVQLGFALKEHQGRRHCGNYRRRFPDAGAVLTEGRQWTRYKACWMTSLPMLLL